MELVIVACVPNKRFGNSGGRSMVTEIEVREFLGRAKVAKTVKSSSGSLTGAQKKLLKRKYKKAEALRGSVSSAWGRQAINALKNPSMLPTNIPDAREGVRMQADSERTRQNDIEGRKLTSLKERSAWMSTSYIHRLSLSLRLFSHVSQWSLAYDPAHVPSRLRFQITLY